MVVEAATSMVLAVMDYRGGGRVSEAASGVAELTQGMELGRLTRRGWCVQTGVHTCVIATGEWS